MRISDRLQPGMSLKFNSKILMNLTFKYMKLRTNRVSDFRNVLSCVILS